MPLAVYNRSKMLKEEDFMREKAKKQVFLTGVIVLTCANLITKIIGLVFKIPLTNMLGNEGMGYFNTAYQIYTWLYMLSTAGVPVALSILVSEYNAKNNPAAAKKLFRLTISVFSAFGLLASLAMLVFSRNLAEFIAADLSFLCIMAISPALFFVCISSTVRGYFQGQRNMVPTAVSEIIESLLKLCVGIALGMYALKKGYPIYRVAAYAIFGVTVGVIFGAVFLALSALLSGCLRREKTADLHAPEEIKSKAMLASFFKVALPVMLSSSLLSMSSMIDTLIVMRRLQDIGFAKEAAVAVYGNYTAYCVTLFNLPPVLIYPIVSALIPALCSAVACGNDKKISLLLNKSLKLSAIISLPCTVGLALMSYPVLSLIFESKANAEMAAPLLSVLAPSVFLIGVMAVTNGVLQSFRKQKYSVYSMIAGAAVKAVSAYLLPAVKVGDGYLGIYASPISTFLFYLTITALNFYFIARYAKVKFSALKIFIRPLLSALLCGASAIAVYGIAVRFSGESRLITLLSIFTAAVVYGIFLILLGAVNRSDTALIPKLDRIIEKVPLLSFLVSKKDN